MALSIFPFPTPHAHGKPEGGSYIRERRPENADGNAPGALQHTWSGHANSHVSEVYKKLLKQREWRLRWAEKTGTGFALPGHQQAVAVALNDKSGKILEFRKVG